MIQKNKYREDKLVELLDLVRSDNINNPKTENYSQVRESLSGYTYTEIELDGLTRERVKELQLIAKSIEKKVVSHKLENPARFKINYANELNAEQLSAVLEIANPLLVIAGAGSGKTRVITYKVSYLIEKGYLPEEILLLTFTRKASKEMLNRVSALLKGEYPGNVFGGTFHSFANYILRTYHRLINMPPNFTIIDTQDAADIVDLVKTELKLGKKKDNKAFPRKATIYDIISKARNLEQSIDEIIDTYHGNLEVYQQEINVINEYFIIYKKASNLLDYDDLLDKLRFELKSNTPFRNALQNRFKYILVDEYQDTNLAQDEIVELIVGNRSCVTVVGDDMQSIYSFRGANFENILRFPTKFPLCKVVKIETNYRSSNQILDFTNRIIDSALLGFKKKLAGIKESPNVPSIKKFYDPELEATFIVDKMLELRNKEIPLTEIAVLVRAMWHSNYVQAELIKRSIPFVVIGGIKFVERRHVKDVMAFLKISFNVLDAVSWHRVLILVRGIGKVTARDIVREIRNKNGTVDFSRFKGKKFAEALNDLSALINGLIKLQQNPVQAIEDILSYYRTVLEGIEADAEIRFKDLEVLVGLASKYDSVERFLSDLTLEPPSNKIQDSLSPLIDQSDEKPVTISTIHSAKGLEWHTVFVPFALDGLIPSVKSLGSIEELEEERRLFYVACSRPKENLYITMPSFVSSWDAVFTQPSRFLPRK
ncbi:ATP-dependent helicase [Maribellus mangrovi]|uniref:ATP-dependent helicase n=1 Tax=Maribellus mangrovi TaxID=3133146 RepID=UPI0030ECAE04